MSDHITSETSAGRIKRSPDSGETHINPLGLVPKSGQPGRFRLIMDLSSPKGHSVNDAISSSLSSLKYAAVDQAVQMIQLAGQGALLAKIDLQNAYRVVPIHPIDQPLLSLRWEKVVY